ncbi:MurR/RpiR family transcriptional regulator [Erysipelothrix aquatica]|uniref:MurR/RpiR family transcriptional regulator n=1 Tax=Erysipelothrix aquatica TaxID=2683714 RepID=UPI00135752A5|nr:MurR/RpiR family transcriptional regulator [Erysipelothrix aquatica]
MGNQLRVLDALEFHRADLTQTEQRLADFILEKPQRVVGMSIQTLAVETETSASAVSRLCRKIGVESFQTFKVMLSSELARHSYKSANEILHYSKPQEAKHDILKSAFEAMNQTTEDLTMEEINPIVELLYRAKNIFLYGDGFSVLAVENFRQKWLRVGKAVFVVNDQGSDRVTMYSQKEDSVYVAISNSGNSSKVLELMLFAKSIGFKTLAISRRADSRIEHNSDYNLYTAPVSTEPTALTNSIYAQFIAIDILYSAYVTRYGLQKAIVVSDYFK